MPGLVLKAEAIVGPDQLVAYLGVHDRYRPECHLAYDNQLMVMLWSALATRDTRLLHRALGRRGEVPAGTGWVSYVRCHDDIGWAVGDEDAWALGIDPAAHRRFLAAFYAGDHPGSFARGVDFQVDPRDGSRRTSGTAASLCGLESALESGDAAEVDAARAPDLPAARRRPTPTAASRCSTWATRSRCSTTAAGPTTRSTPTTTGGSTGR